jgi:hypothetical protein
MKTLLLARTLVAFCLLSHNSLTLSRKRLPATRDVLCPRR